MSNKISATLGALILAATTGTIAYAGSSRGQDNDALTDLSKAQVPIAQAIATAEQAASGKATKAKLENKRQGPVYEIEVANPSTRKIMDVRVDAASGAVLSTRDDHADHEGSREDDD